MIDLENFQGFTAVGNFDLTKQIKLNTPITVEIKNLPVLVSPGARFQNTADNLFSFSAYGTVVPGEEIIVSKNKINYLLENKLIELI